MESNPGTLDATAAPRPAAGRPSTEDRNLALAAHWGIVLAGLLSAAVLAFVPPLIVYLMRKDRSPWVAFHSLQALYWSIATLLLTIPTCGLALIVGLVWAAVAGFKILGGEELVYPVVGKWARGSVASS